MIKHPIIVVALSLFVVSAVVLFAAICLNLVVYSYIDYTFAAAK